MARIRTIKPELARHIGLFRLEQETGWPIRFAWAMLFTACDRDGRFRWQPEVLKLDVLPFDDVDFSRVLDAWLTRGFIVKYRVGHAWYGWIPTWRRHQVINNRESASESPPFEDADEVEDHRNQPVIDACPTRAPRVPHGKSKSLCNAQGEGEGEGERNEASYEASCPEPKSDDPPAITFTLNTGAEHPVTQQQLDEFASLYPGIDVMQELRKLKGWCSSNPTKRKTKRGASAFVNSWLSRAQDECTKHPRGNGNGNGQTQPREPSRAARVFRQFVDGSLHAAPDDPDFLEHDSGPVDR